MWGYNKHMSDSEELEKLEPAEKLSMPDKAMGVDAYEAKKTEEAAEAEESAKDKNTIENLDSLERLDEVITKIQPELEERRKKLLNMFTGGTVFLVSTITSVLLFKLDMPVDDIYFPVTIFSLLGTLLLFQIINGWYRVSTKKEFLTALAEGTGMEWNKKGMFSVQEIEKHCVLPPSDRHDVVDGFSGTYKNIPLSFQEITLTDLVQDHNDRKKTREFVNFWGLAVRIKLRRPLSSHTVVMPRNALQTYFRTRFSKFQRIKLVSNKFEKKYDVMGTDQVEGRVILDPAFIERFMEAGEHLNSRWIEASFMDDEAIFVIERKRPLCDVGQVWSKVSEERLKNSIKDIETVLGLIDILKLNPQVGI